MYTPLIPGSNSNPLTDITGIIYLTIGDTKQHYIEKVDAYTCEQSVQISQPKEITDYNFAAKQ